MDKKFPFRLAVALFKNGVRKLWADEGLAELAELAGDELTTRLERWLQEEKRRKALKKATEEADRCFEARTNDPALRQFMAGLPLRGLSSLIASLESLPEESDDDALGQAIQTAIQQSWRSLDENQIEIATNLYLLCLRRALLPLVGEAGYAEAVVGQATLRIEEKVDQLQQQLVDWIARERQQIDKVITIYGNVIFVQGDYHVHISVTNLWTIGPDDLVLPFLEPYRDPYLTFLIESNATLTLPDGRRVPLERVYVSLRADQMNAAERRAEHDAYWQEVQQILAESLPSDADPYQRQLLMVRGLLLHPRMTMLEARDWERVLGRRERSASRNLAEVVAEHPVAVLLGDPGSGKTTLGRWLTLQHARALKAGASSLRVPLDRVQPGADAPERIIDLGPPRLPLFIRVAQYAAARWPQGSPAEGNDLTLEDFIARGKLDYRELPVDLPPRVVGMLGKQALTQGQAMIIFDGLDEVTDLDQRRAVMETIHEFIRSWLPKGNRFLVTSRIVGYQFAPLTEYPHYTVQAMDETAIRAFCHAWMGYFHAGDEAKRHGDALAQAIFEHDHPSVRSMAGNPLLLTLLAQVYQGGDRSLPHRRVDLFAEVFRVFYKQRQHLWEAMQISESRLAQALAAVARYLQEEEPTGMADRGSVRYVLRQALSQPDQVEAVLQIAEEGAGFLISRGGAVYAFLHRGLQEYFAALALTQLPPHGTRQIPLLEALTQHGLDPAWREPLVLALGILHRADYPLPSQRRTQLREQVWQTLLNLEDPAGEVLPRAALLAAAAFPECAQAPTVQVMEEMMHRLLKAYMPESPQTLKEAIHRAVASLRHSPVASQIGGILAQTVEDDAFPRRWAALDWIIETDWFDHRPLLDAILRAWTTHATPSAAMMVALYRYHERHPTWFEDADLPFRRAVEAHPAWWERAAQDENWRAVLTALYLAPWQAYEPANIWRDSPLTPWVLEALATNDLESLAQKIRQVNLNAGTPAARDAALARAAWDDETLAGAWSNIQAACGVIGSLSVLSLPAHDLANAFANVSSYSYALNLALDLARTLGRTRSHFLDIAHNRDYFLDLNLNHLIERAIVIDYALARYLARTRILYLDRNNTLDLDRAFNRTLDLVHELALDLLHTLDHALVLQHGLDYDFALDRALGFDCTGKFTPSLPLPSASIREVITEINTLSYKTQRYRENFPQIWKAIQQVTSRAQSLSKLKTLSYLNALLDIKRRFPVPAEQAKESILLILDIASVSPEALVAAMTHSQDVLRRSVLQALNSPSSASKLGLGRLEALAALAAEYDDDPRVGPILTWFLERIEHDRVDWVEAWMAAAAEEEDTPAERLLNSLYKPNKAVARLLWERLPHASTQINTALLHALRWQADLGQIPQAVLDDLDPPPLARLAAWLHVERDPAIQKALINVLGHWRFDPAAAMNVLLEVLDQEGSERITADNRSAAYTALARLAAWEETLRPQVKSWLEARLPASASALVRLLAAQQGQPAFLLEAMAPYMSSPQALLHALLDAGVDDDVWWAGYHGLLAQAVQVHLASHPRLMPHLIQRLRQAVADDDWPQRRMALAAVVACVETMPAQVQNAAGGPRVLETLLLQGRQDVQSFSVRRFVLTALSYLRTVTPAVAPVLVEALQENIVSVQQDAIRAVSRFQRIEGDAQTILDALTSHLHGPSAAVAYGVAKLLGALGVSPAGQAADLRPRIIRALAEAIRDPFSEEEVFLMSEEKEWESKGLLKETLYEELLRVAGWL